MIETKMTPGIFTLRVLIYVLLTGFALLMLFPFLYMLSTSFKSSPDVYNYPPRLLPYSPVSITQPDGSTAQQYNFVIMGQQRTLITTGEKKRFAFFTTQDNLNLTNARESKILVQAPVEEATATGQEVTLQGADGKDQKFEEFEVTVAGGRQKLLLAYRGQLDEFTDPADPTFIFYAVARVAEKVEIVEFQTGNYGAVLGQSVDLGKLTGVPTDRQLNLDLRGALVNTIFVTLGVTIGQLITSIFGGYAFSRMKFRGRDAIFLVYLGSIMIPFVVLIIPMYRLMVAIGWQNRIVSLIVPWIFTAYGTFLMRQFFITMPKDLEEAALLDGCSRFQILWGIFVPLSTPAIATLGIFSFLYAWNSFLWPLLIIGEGNETNHVLTLSLIRLSNAFADQPNFVLTGAAVAILPPILIFILAQRYFIEGTATSGLK